MYQEFWRSSARLRMRKRSKKLKERARSREIGMARGAGRARPTNDGVFPKRRSILAQLVCLAACARGDDVDRHRRDDRDHDDPSRVGVLMHLWEWFIWGAALAAPITVFVYLWTQRRIR